MAQSRYCGKANGFEFMSLTRGLSCQYGRQEFAGYSIAGQTTSVFHKNSKVCFDIGQGLPFHLSAKAFCLTHLHADHGSGLHYVLSQRSLFRLPKVPILLPGKHLKSAEIIIKEWEKIEELQYAYELIPAEEGLQWNLDNGQQLRAYPTPHRIESFAYVLFDKKKKLLKKYQELKPHELIELRKKGLSLEETLFEPLIAFSGDTQIEFLERYPIMLKSQILFMECTYLDEKKSIAETRKWGHIHLDEILFYADQFQNQFISLIHLSARYKIQEALDILEKKLPSSLKEKIQIFPRPY